ncbi:fasciclin domain-containing protein [Roseomonas chloroacetimidivorans]|uniref:fasciclin domain-containing protein n=1 Tax=Roseomonas chloroacetimidivorans TaxID=1766656 RepID=UPI003C72C482
MAVAAVVVAGWLSASAAQAQNAVEFIRNQNDLNIFARIIERSGLTERLSGPGPFAIYAPTDGAFRQHPYAHREAVDRAPQPELQRLVLSHVAQHTREESLVSGSGPRSEQMLSGANVRFERQIQEGGEGGRSGGVTINGIGVLDNSRVSNGIVHRLNGVLTLN